MVETHTQASGSAHARSPTRVLRQLLPRCALAQPRSSQAATSRRREAALTALQRLS